MDVLKILLTVLPLSGALALTFWGITKGKINSLYVPLITMPKKWVKIYRRTWTIVFLLSIISFVLWISPEAITVKMCIILLLCGLGLIVAIPIATLVCVVIILLILGACDKIVNWVKKV
jgi:hypothetical protein